MTNLFAAYPKGFTLPYGNPSNADLDAIAATGAKIVRVGYPEIQNMFPSPGTGTLSSLIDRVFARGMDFHFSGLGVTTAINADAGTGGNNKYHSTSSGNDTTLAGYYATLATLFQAKMDANPGRTIYAEANQEANIVQYNPGAQSYARIAAETLAIYTEMRANSTDVIMVGPSFANRGDWSNPIPSDVGHTSPAALNSLITAETGLKTMFDFLGHHPYIGSSDPNADDPWAMGQLIAYIYEAQVSQAMKTHGTTNPLKVCVTEFGLKRTGVESGYTFTETNQQLRMVALLNRFHALRDGGNLGGPEEYYTRVVDQKAIFKSDNSPYGAGVIWMYDGAQSADPPPPSAPVASFQVANGSGLAPLAVQFTDTSTGGAITTWAWTFGDGQVSSAHSPSHTYQQPGTYTVTFTATNAGGSSSASAQIVVTTPNVIPPTPFPVPDDPVGAVTLATNYYTKTDHMPGNNLDGDRLWSRDENHPLRHASRPVIYLGGLGGYGGSIGPVITTGIYGDPNPYVYPACIHVLNARSGRADGYTFIGCAPGGQWGNDTAMTNLADVIALIQDDTTIWGGAKAGRVALIGESMGHSTAINYAVRHPEQVAGVVGLNPVVSLVYHYNGGVDNILEPPGHGGAPTSINTAFGLPTSPNALTLDETVRLERDPMVLVDQITDVPWSMFWHLQDTVVDHQGVEDWIAAKGSTFTVLHRYDTGNHGEMRTSGEELLTALDGMAWGT